MEDDVRHWADVRLASGVGVVNAEPKLRASTIAAAVAAVGVRWPAWGANSSAILPATRAFSSERFGRRHSPSTGVAWDGRWPEDREDQAGVRRVLLQHADDRERRPGRPSARPDAAAASRADEAVGGDGVLDRGVDQLALDAKTRKMVPSATPAASAIWRVTMLEPVVAQQRQGGVDEGPAAFVGGEGGGSAHVGRCR